MAGILTSVWWSEGQLCLRGRSMLICPAGAQTSIPCTALLQLQREKDRAREKGMSGWGSKHGRDVRDVDGCEEMSAGK